MGLVKGTSCTQDSIRDLFEMLMMKRPAFSWADVDFITNFLRPLGVEVDTFGNVYKKIGRNPLIAWSSHTDTVHDTPGYQLITKDDKGIIKIPQGSLSNCLGADDTAGVWLMCELIKAERPGLYIFHRAEERGGRGANWISTNRPKFVDGIQTMIALDRKANDSVITFQSGGRCCSDMFGKSLAEQMEKGGAGQYRLDQGGSFTDSACYTGLLAECTNLSVGYNYQHTRSEELDLVHLLKVREALIALNAKNLVIKRKPGEKEARTYPTYNYNNRGNENWRSHSAHNNSRTHLDPNYCPPIFRGGYWADNKWIPCNRVEWQARLDEQAKAKPSEAKLEESNKLSKETITKGQLSKKLFRSHHGVTSEYTVEDICRDYPALVAQMFEDWGFDAAFLMEEVLDRKVDTPTKDAPNASMGVSSTIN